MYELNDEDMLIGKQLKALSESTRYKIVKLLLEKHRCSRSLALELGITESAISQHMTVLREAGLVYRYRHRHHIHYEVNLDALATLRDMFDGWINTASEVGDCHTTDPCHYERPDGTVGCLYGTVEGYHREHTQQAVESTPPRRNQRHQARD